MADWGLWLMWWGLGFVAGFGVGTFLIFYVKATSSIWPWLNKFGSTKPKPKVKVGRRSAEELEQEFWDRTYKKGKGEGDLL